MLMLLLLLEDDTPRLEISSRRLIDATRFMSLAC